MDLNKLEKINTIAPGISVYRNDQNSEEFFKDYFELFYSCFGVRETLESRWYKWYYEQNPFGRSECYLLADTRNGKFVGSYSFGKNILIKDQKEHGCCVGVNGMTSPAYRGKGLYPKIIDAAVKDNPDSLCFTLLHGANIATIRGHYSCGWKTVKKIPFYYKQVGAKKNETNVREIINFNMFTEQDLNDFNTFKSNCFKRTIEYLNWRFCNRPHKKYTVLSLQEKGEHSAYMVLSKYVSKDGFARMQIVDFSIKNTEQLNLLIHKAEYTAYLEKCNIIDLWMDTEINTEFFNPFKKCGFTRTEEFYEFLCHTKDERYFSPETKIFLADLDAV